MAPAWTKKLAVGLPLIDQQHQELFCRFGAFFAACQVAQGKEQVDAMLRFLGSYVNFHFQEEEQLMARHAYPEAQAHRDEHRAFVAQLGTLKEELRQNGPSSPIVIQLNQTLLDWLLRHIKQIDLPLGQYLLRHTSEADRP